MEILEDVEAANMTWIESIKNDMKILSLPERLLFDIRE